MRISKTTHNALQILIATAKAGKNLIKGAAVAHELDITEQNTSKIVHMLSRGGFIKAVRGPHGGMTLAQSPEHIRVGDVVLAMERMAVEDERNSDGGFNHLFDDALEAFVSVLNQHTLSDIARGKRGTGLTSLSDKQGGRKAKPPKRKASRTQHVTASKSTTQPRPRTTPK